MKKLLLLLCATLSLSHVKASDTLTVRQVFNFSVGDTFDYKSSITYYNVNVTIPTTYSRYIITGKYYFNDSIVYFRRQVYPSISLDTLIYTGLNDPIIQQDTSPNGNVVDTFYIGISSWDSIYNIHYTNVGEGSMEAKFESGLGITDIESKVWGDVIEDESDVLIYYSKNNTRAGTPYYEQLTSVDDLKTISAINVYPNPATEQIHLSISNTSQYNARLILTDLLGQEVYSSPITQSETTHDISKLPFGIYTWRVVSDNAIIKTGKIVKE